jgi:lambda family phage tail tape measure protein
VASAGVIEAGVTLRGDGADLVGAYKQGADAARQYQRQVDEMARAQRSAETDGKRFLASLREQYMTYGKSEAEIMRYKAAQAGVLGSAGPLIARLEALKENQRKLNEEQARGAGASDSLSGRLSVLRGHMAGAAVLGAGAAIAAFSSEIVQTGMALQRMTTGLNFATGSAEAGRQEYAFLRNQVQELGLDLDTSGRAFMRFAAAAKGTALEGGQARDIFRAVASAATVMGLSAPEAEGALLAISQMISKGTVQAEELRGQLGERLPGAFQIAARAMGMTTAELGKLLEAGGLAASDFLPKFAAELQRTVGGTLPEAARSAQAESNRLNSAWTEMKQTLGQLGVMDAAASKMRLLANVLGDVTAGLKDVSGQKGILDKLLSGAMGLGSAAGTAVRGLFGTNAARDSNPAALAARSAASRALARDGTELTPSEQNMESFWAAEAAVQKKRIEALKGYRTDAQKLKDEIAAYKKEFEGKITPAQMQADLKLIGAKYAKKDESKAEAELRKYTSAAQGLEEALRRLNGETDLQSLQYKLTKGTLADLTPKHKQYLLQIGEEIDAKRIAQETARALAETASQEDARLSASNDVLAAYNEAQSVKVQQLEFELGLIGKSAAETERLRAVEQLRLDTLASLKQVANDPEAQTRVEAQAAAVRERLLPVLAERQRLERDWQTGFKEGIRSYIEEVTNGAAAAQRVVTNSFKSMEDALVNFARTGKLDFKSLADSIIGDLVRIRVQQNITKPLAGMLDGASAGAGAWLANALGVGQPNYGANYSDLAGYVSHTGSGPGDVMPTRMLPASTWSGAPRFHSGIGPNERAAIITKDESVLTPGQMRQLAPAGGGPSAISVEIRNQGTPQQVVSATPRFDGARMVIDLVTRDLASNGPISQSMQGRFGLRMAS